MARWTMYCNVRILNYTAHMPDYSAIFSGVHGKASPQGMYTLCMPRGLPLLKQPHSIDSAVSRARGEGEEKGEPRGGCPKRPTARGGNSALALLGAASGDAPAGRTRHLLAAQGAEALAVRVRAALGQPPRRAEGVEGVPAGQLHQ